MAMSDYLEEALIALTYNSGSFTAPTEWWVALYNASPGDANIEANEINQSAAYGYATQQFTPTTAVEGASGFKVTNTSDITWDTATQDWDTINFIAVFDGSDTSSANLLDYGAITTPRTVLTDGIFKILAGELQINYN